MRFKTKPILSFNLFLSLKLFFGLRPQLVTALHQQ